MPFPAYVGLDSIHRPSNGAIAPTAWGDQVNDDMANVYGQLAQMNTAKAHMTLSGTAATITSGGGGIDPIIGYTSAYDPGSNLNASTGTYTCPVTGLYLMDLSAFFSTSTTPTGVVELIYYVNGTQTRQWSQPTSTQNQSIAVAPQSQRTAGDVITLGALTTTTATFVTVSNVNFAIALLTAP